MSTYLFVHGAWHGGWCWEKIVSRLEKLGHKAIAPDLPGLGQDNTPLNRVTLELWRDHICDIAAAQSQPVVLVGHSRGGIVISEVAEHRPKIVRTLVYVTAFLLRDKESLFDKAAQDPESLIVKNMVMSEDKTSSTVRDEALREGFYEECSEEDFIRARSLLRPEPSLPLATPVRVTEGNWGGVPRVYIECLRDKALRPHMQKQMYTTLPCRKVLSIDTDHSPFYSRPDELVAHLRSV
ncbi:MAG: alpha/beta fold hydrolase [Gammaproteobacteria bacterium]